MSYSSLLEYTPLIWDNISIEHCEQIKKILNKALQLNLIYLKP